MSRTLPERFRFGPILAGTVATVLLLVLFGRIADLILLLFIAVLISLFLGALADFFVRHAPVSRPFALALAVILSVAALAGLIALLFPPVIRQTRELVEVLPTYLEAWERGVGRFLARYPALRSVWRPDEHQLVTSVFEQVTSGFDNLVPRVVSIVHVAINLVSVAVMSIYLALQPGLYREWLIALFPPVHRDLVRDVLGDLGSNLRAWIVAQLLAMVVLAILTAIGLYLLHVPYSLTFGVFTGMVAIVPFFGTLVSTLLPALFVLGGDGVWGMGPGAHAWLVILLGAVIHIIEGNLVIPLITAKRVELPPVLTIMSVLVVGKLLGLGGLLIAVPTLAVAMVVLRRILINRVYEGQGFRRAARDRAHVLRVPAPEGGVLVADTQELDIVADAERVA